MSKQKRTTARAKNGQNNLLIFFAIVIVLAIISIIIAFYYMDESGTEADQADKETTEVPNAAPLAVEGSWVSNYDGKILTISGLNMSIESPSVDGTAKITGRISIENNIITFVNSSGGCKGIEGHYLFSFTDDGELFFKLIKDSCESRIERNTMNWFRI